MQQYCCKNTLTGKLYDIVVGSDSTIHVVFDSPSNDSILHRFMHTQSKDDGETWSEPIVIYERDTPIPSGAILHAAIDERNRIHVAITFRSFEYGEFSELGYLRSPDEGVEWDEYKVIEDRTDTFFGGIGTIGIYAFEKDEIHLTFHGPQRKHQFSLVWQVRIPALPPDIPFSRRTFLFLCSPIVQSES